MKKINIRLKKILEQRDLTQLDISQATGIRPNAISNLCRNYVDRLTIEHLERICEELNISDMNELIEIIDIPEENKK